MKIYLAETQAKVLNASSKYLNEEGEDYQKVISLVNEGKYASLKDYIVERIEKMANGTEFGSEEYKAMVDLHKDVYNSEYIGIDE